MIRSKDDAVAFIKQTIDDGNEVAIYRVESLRTADEFKEGESWWPTKDVAPVYIGRIFNSAVFELEDRLGGKPLTYGLIHKIVANNPADEAFEFDFR